MIITPRFVLVLSLAVAGPATRAAADTYPRQPGVDAIHYVFRLSLLTDPAAKDIVGEATITLRFVADGVRQVELDLTSAAEGKGMTVSAVTAGGQPVSYTHQGDRLRIALPAPPAAGEERAFAIQYHGIPAQGLRLIDNIHGEPTAFSENWPNRARQWLPMIDHPYDKATGEFIVTTSSRYQVVANGLLVEELDLDGGQRRTHWKQSVPIASWLYAIGVARFAVGHYGYAKGVPLQVWVFPQNRDKYGVFEATGRQALEFFSEQVGPYAYEKLAHVQAAGFGGGTEHASAIFYGEKGVASGRAPVVHEVAHQWFGDAVTETDWDDVWLSEGFATYFTLLYTERFEGRDAFVEGLQRSRNSVLQLEQRLPDTPVIHRNLADMARVLNQLVYQKGGWTLHMLRAQIGTDAFWTGIRDYYRRYENRNATTADLRRIMEGVSGQDLSWFFAQWLTRSGVPKLTGSWSYDAAAKQVRLELTQAQPGEPYRLPIEIGVSADAASAARVERVLLTARQGTFAIAADKEPVAVTLDPNTWLLMEPPLVVRK